MIELHPGDIRYDNIGYFSWASAAAPAAATALIDLSRAEPIEISYGELDQRLDRFARLTGRLGLKAGESPGNVGEQSTRIHRDHVWGYARRRRAVPLNTRLGNRCARLYSADSACVRRW